MLQVVMIRETNRSQQGWGKKNSFMSLLVLLVQREGRAGGKLDGHLDVINLTGIQVVLYYSL